MRIADVDLIATSGRSPLHRAAPPAKLWAFACVLAAVLVNNNALVLAGIAAALAAVVVATRLPGRPLAMLAAYPAFFAAVFAATTSAGPLDAAVVVAKAVTSALAALVIVFSTPYPQMLAPVQRLVPRVLSDALLLTYRSLFLLVEKLEHLVRAARLRAGLAAGRPVASARSAMLALGGLLLYSLDLSQRTYDVMRVRGYEGRLRVATRSSRSPVLDVAVMGAGMGFLVVAVVFRFAWATLNPVSWLATAAGLTALLAASLGRLVSRGLR